MNKKLFMRLTELIKSKTRKKRWHRVVSFLMAAVVFITTYALILPAITLEIAPECGIEEHMHTDECYDENGNLICGLVEHTHTDECRLLSGFNDIDSFVYGLPTDTEPIETPKVIADASQAEQSDLSSSELIDDESEIITDEQHDGESEIITDEQLDDEDEMDIYSDNDDALSDDENDEELEDSQYLADDEQESESPFEKFRLDAAEDIFVIQMEKAMLFAANDSLASVYDYRYDSTDDMPSTATTGNAANQWQDVSGDYSTSTYAYDVANKSVVRIKKNVIPTGVDDRFQIYLTIEPLMSIEEFLNGCDHYQTHNNSSTFNPSSGVSKILSQEEYDALPDKPDSSGEYKALYTPFTVDFINRTVNPPEHIYVTRYGNFTGSGKNSIQLVKNGGYCLNAEKFSIQGFKNKIDWPALINNPQRGLEVDLTEFLMQYHLADKTVYPQTVTDPMGDYIKFERMISYDGGSFIAPSAENNYTLTWNLPTKGDSSGTPKYHQTHLETASDGRTISVIDNMVVDNNAVFYTNVFEMRYEVSLKSSAEGFVGVTSKSSTTTPENAKYPTNKTTTLNYKNGAAQDFNVDFPIPIVRGIATEPTPSSTPEPTPTPTPMPEPERPDMPETTTINKTIDYLGDGVANPDTSASGDDLYRLYLNFKNEAKPIDLLLVVDQSGSMGYDMDGQNTSTTGAPSRQEVFTDFLNGENDNGNGFIKKFLELNSNNDLAILTFGSDCSLTPQRYIRHWGETSNTTTFAQPDGATNYTAALDIASQVLAQSPNNDNQKVMVFIGDGVPTVAYKDGRMHSSFANPDNVFFLGNETYIKPINQRLNGYINILSYENTPGVSGVHNIRVTYFDRTEPREDDLGNVAVLPNFSTRAGTFDGMPICIDVKNMQTNIPGLASFPAGDITDSNALNDFINQWKSMTNDEQVQWCNENVVLNSYDTYDIFALTESSYNDFVNANPDTVVYTVGYSNELIGAYESGRPKDEVLKYFAGEDGQHNPKYYLSNSIESLEDIFIGIAGLHNVRIEDTLSNYAKLTNSPDLKVTMKDDNTSYVLYENNALTTKGNEVLDTTEPILASNGKLVVQFKPEYSYMNDFEVEASFNIKPTGAAYREKYENGYNAEGDAHTDYSANTTSSGQDGFFSNGTAKVTWTANLDKSESFPKPVIQVGDVVPLTISKTVSGDTTDEEFSFEAIIQNGEFLTPLSTDQYVLDTSGNAHFRLANGDSITLLVTEGSTVKLQETSHDGYSVSIKKDTTTVSNTDAYETTVSSDTSLTVTNTLIKEPEDVETVTINKTIDYLGDGEANPDTTATGDDLYRLYLNLTSRHEPVDLLLVIDQSYSMNYTIDGGSTGAHAGEPSRQDILTDFLNGENDNGEGFIHDFLEADYRNDLAILTFSDDSSMLPKRYIRQWGDTSDVTVFNAPSGATNYTAALDNIDDVFALRLHPDNRKIVVFLSDGEPTIGYLDGKLHSSFADEDNLFYLGNSPKIYPVIDGFFEMMYYEVEYGFPMEDGRAWALMKDVCGSSDDYGRQGFGYSYATLDGYPYCYCLPEISLDVQDVGITEYPWGDFTEPDCSTFKDFYAAWQNKTNEEKLAWFREHLIDMPIHDMFALTKSSFDEFKRQNPDVTVYSIGYGSDFVETIESGVSVDDVLKYFGDNDRYFPSTNEEELAEVFTKITGIENIRITDTLSNYARLAGNPELKITMKEDTESYTLYENGALTEKGQEVLDTTTPILTSNGNLTVQFKPELKYLCDVEVEASFNIRPNGRAYREFENNGYNAEGDEDTDYAANMTSSGQDGFFSNGTAVASWTTDEEKSKEFPKPVIQVHDTTLLTVTKAVTDYTTDEEFPFIINIQNGVFLEPLSTDKYVLDSNGNAHFNLKDGESITLEVSKGSVVNLQETSHTGYSVNIKQGGTVVSDTDTYEATISSDTSLLVNNVRTLWSIVVNKTDKNDSNVKLKGAIFGLYSPKASDQLADCGNYPSTIEKDGVTYYLSAISTTNSDGQITWSDLPESNYIVKELEAPDGYYMTDELFNVATDFSGQTVNVDVSNEAGYELPETGGSGTYTYTLWGLMLMALALVCGYILRRKYERRLF